MSFPGEVGLRHRAAAVDGPPHPGPARAHTLERAGVLS
ncbi:hypothetical protein J2S22_004718 [Rhodoplanes tepidamans]|nr:hypothetical protein [Rhodoplanes tepidamans]